MQCSGVSGVPEINNSSLTLQESLKDDIRVQYYHDHLLALQSAVRYELLSLVL
jgi:beta-glucosidase